MVGRGMQSSKATRSNNLLKCIKENIHKRWMEHFQLSGDVNFTRFETISCILWDKRRRELDGSLPYVNFVPIVLKKVLLLPLVYIKVPININTN